MDTVLKADIFFFVATIAIVLITTFVVTALWYAIKILRTYKETSLIIKNTVLEVSQNVLHVEDTLKNFFENLNVIQLLRLAFTPKRKNTKNVKQEKEEHGTKE